MRKITKLVAMLLVTELALAGQGAVDDIDAKYDRLDGVGSSGKRVNVIEWEGNLEIHVYPAGSLSGLGLKIDRENKKKPVMVISYRFDNSPKPLIRRAILSIPLKDGFNTYRDKTAGEYDKIIITNNSLSTGAELASFKLDAEPTQLYPDEHPSQLAKQEKDKGNGGTPRKPAQAQKAKPPEAVDEDGSLKHFDF